MERRKSSGRRFSSLFFEVRGRVVGADLKQVLRRQRNLEVAAVGNHVERGRAHHRIFAEDADVRRLAEENVGTDIFDFRDLSGINAADGGRQIDLRLERIHGIIDVGDARVQLVARGVEEFGRRGRASPSCRAGE